MIPHLTPGDLEPLADALYWVDEAHPLDTPDGMACVFLPWDAWNDLRAALDLPSQYPEDSE